MKWEKKETSQNVNPYYYVTEYEGMMLSISVPYVNGNRSDPWQARLTFGPQTLRKAAFRLRNHGPESEEDLEKAKEKAFKIMDGYLKHNIDQWTKLREWLEKMKAQSEDES